METPRFLDDEFYGRVKARSIACNALAFAMERRDAGIAETAIANEKLQPAPGVVRIEGTDELIEGDA